MSQNVASLTGYNVNRASAYGTPIDGATVKVVITTVPGTHTWAKWLVTETLCLIYLTDKAQQNVF